MKSTKKNKIKYGNVELSENEFDPKHGKVRVTMWMELDLLKEIRERAAKEGEKYQRWIKKNLRDLLAGNTPTDIAHRLEVLEKAVFKKRA